MNYGNDNSLAMEKTLFLRSFCELGSNHIKLNASPEGSKGDFLCNRSRFKCSLSPVLTLQTHGFQAYFLIGISTCAIVAFLQATPLVNKFSTQFHF